MKRIDRTPSGRSLWVALFIIVAASLAGCATAGVNRSQQVNGASVSYRLAGNGAPAVVFEAGLGDSKSSWSAVFSRIAGSTRVFAYDRPGYGPGLPFRGSFQSDRDGSRTGEEVARHLRDLLDRAGVEPPFVLVGHSIGGLYVLTFAKLFPDDVAGIVLVDGRPADFTAACESESAGMCKPPGLMVAMLPPHQKAEVRGMPETERQAPRPEDFGGIPITVIAATKPDVVSSRAFQELWLERQRAFAEAVGGRYVEAAGAGHYVHHQRPGLVADEILRVLDQGRSAPNRLLPTP